MDTHRVLEALDDLFAKRLDGCHLSHELSGRRAHEDFIGISERLQSCSEIHHRAQRRGHPQGVRCLGGDCHSCRNSDVRGLSWASAPTRKSEIVRCRADVDCGSHRSLGVVLSGHRVTEHGEYPVTQELVDASTPSLDRLLPDDQERLDERAHVFGFVLLRHGGEPAQVGEEHGESAPLRADLGNDVRVRIESDAVPIAVDRCAARATEPRPIDQRSCTVCALGLIASVLGIDRRHREDPYKLLADGTSISGRCRYIDRSAVGSMTMVRPRGDPSDHREAECSHDRVSAGEIVRLRHHASRSTITFTDAGGTAPDRPAIGRSQANPAHRSCTVKQYCADSESRTGRRRR